MPRQSIVVQVGQCGNQLGAEFFEALARGMHENENSATPNQKAPQQPLSSSLPTFFRATKKGSVARAVLLDTEPRVVEQVSRRTTDTVACSWAYGGETTSVGGGAWKTMTGSGSANNWAFGYLKHGPRLEEGAVESIRREAELCDQLGSVLAIQSLAGGTGSGLGSRLAEAVQDAFPSALSLHTLVAPFDTGEVVVQAYNSVLSLAHVHDVSDGVVCLYNDELHRICTAQLGLPRPSMADINQVASNQLASLFLPSSPPSPSSLSSPPPSAASAPPLGIEDVVAVMTPSPLFKLLSLRSSPQASAAARSYDADRWDTVTKQLRQMLVTGAFAEQGMNWSVTLEKPPQSAHQASALLSLSNLLVLRGPGWTEAATSPFATPSLYASSSPSSPLTFRGHPASFNGYIRSASLLSNSQSVVEPLDRLLDTAARFRSASAYLHQYHKYGLATEELDEGIASIEQIASDYRTL